MTANIKQDDFLVGNQNSKSDAIAVGDADGLNAFKVSFELVIFQIRLERIVFKITKYTGKLITQIRMIFYEFISRAGENTAGSPLLHLVSN